jgi:hypothetical protein
MVDGSAKIRTEHLQDTSENVCRFSRLGRQSSLLPAVHGVVAVGGLVDTSSADT